MSIDCTLMARAAAREALSRPPIVVNEADGTWWKAYWADMTLGNRTIQCRVEAKLVDILWDHQQEDFLTREFLANAEALASADQA